MGVRMTPAVLLLASLSVAAPPVATDLKLPPGFTAVLVSDHTIANDITTMTVDAAGRVLVAGRGYVRVLVDDDGDGKADRAVDLIDGLKDGPMGLLAEEDSLDIVADGGLKRYRGYDGKNKLKGPPELLLAVKTGGEHDAHAVRRGPDGWLYLMCGNMAGLKKEQIAAERTPVKEHVAGTLLRISPDGKTVEVVADGFRNAYGFDFNPAGEAFTYDSDNERCVGLPWYEPCRFYHVVPGGNYGWRSPQLSQTWRKPPYFADVVPPICTTGRGSPTGVACYRHTHFPEHYRGGFFLADWTFGRVYFVPLAAKGSTYAGKPEVFLEATGDSGFAPTALAVHPTTGDLLVSIGGRGTRGGVYRIRADKGDANPKPIPVAERSLAWDAEAAKGWLADATGDDVLERRRALDMMLRWREKLGFGPKLFDAVIPNLSHDDALVRAAAGRVAVAAAVPMAAVNDRSARLTFTLADVRRNPNDSLGTAIQILADGDDASPLQKLIAVRVMQLAYGDLTAPDAVGTMWEGYSLRKPLTPSPTVPRALAALEAAFPVMRSDPNAAYLERELFRTLALLGGGGVDRVFKSRDRLTSESAILDDIHNLACLARVPGWPPVLVADCLLGLEQKARTQKIARDSHWPLRFEQLTAALGRSSDRVRTLVLEDPSFGQPEHAALVAPLRLDPVAAAKRFLESVQEESPA